jgi:hypothetical protein
LYPADARCNPKKLVCKVEVGEVGVCVVEGDNTTENIVMLMAYIHSAMFLVPLYTPHLHIGIIG